MKQIKRGGLRRRLAVGAAGARGGLGLLTSRASSLLLPKDEQAAHNERALEREAMRFVKQLGELKGAYVKIGQMLALYGEHVLPSPVTSALHTLEAQTEALDWAVIEGALLENLGEAYKVLEVDQSPLAAASLAQVHRACIEGRDACIKVQYPGISRAIDDDFKNVMQMLTLARWVQSGRQLEALTKELKEHLLREVDYGYELQTALQVKTLLADDERYIVPQYYAEYSSETVLAMDYIDGYDVMHESVQGLSLARRNALAVAMLELFFKEAFEWGLMQTDPNFGNYRVVIDEDGVNDKLALLDFGAVHSLSAEFCCSLQQTILSAHQNDVDETIAGAIALNCLKEEDSDKVKASFAAFCIYILEPFSQDLSTIPDVALTKDGLYDWRKCGLLKRAGKLGSEGMLVKGFAIPPSEFMLMMRKLTGVFTFVSALGAELDCAYMLEKYLD